MLHDDASNAQPSGGTVAWPWPRNTWLTPVTLTSAAYTQAFSYDTDNRLTTGPMGTYSYGSSPLHAVTSTTNNYGAAYDAAGDMTCRQVDSSTTCAGSNPTGQTMGYDALRELLTWQNSASNPTQTASYAYDGEGSRVEQVVTANGTTTTTTYVGNYEQIATVSGGATTTTKYYAAGPVQAISVNGTLSYLLNDGQGSHHAKPILAQTATSNKVQMSSIRTTSIPHVAISKEGVLASSNAVVTGTRLEGTAREAATCSLGVSMRPSRSAWSCRRRKRHRVLWT